MQNLLAQVIQDHDHPGRAQLLSRLRDGLGKLTAYNEDLHAAGIVDPERAQVLVSGMERWKHIEATLRFTYDYEGCVLDHGCASDQIVRCEACARESE